MNVDIIDYEIPQEPKVATKIRINIAEIVFNKSAKFNIYYQLENDDIVKTELVNIENEEYKNWNNNDDYIIELVLSKLGLRKKVEHGIHEI